MKNLLSTMSLFFKNYSLVEIMYLLIRFIKIKFFPWNTKNSDRNGINKQNTQAHQTLGKWWLWKRLASMKISDTSYFTNPSLFMGKIQSAPIFCRNFDYSTPSFVKGRGVQLCITFNNLGHKNKNKNWYTLKTRHWKNRLLIWIQYFDCPTETPKSGVSKFDLCLYRAPYMHKTSIWRAPNIVYKNFCVAIILLEKLLEIWLSV